MSLASRPVEPAATRSFWQEILLPERLILALADLVRASCEGIAAIVDEVVVASGHAGHPETDLARCRAARLQALEARYDPPVTIEPTAAPAPRPIAQAVEEQVRRGGIPPVMQRRRRRRRRHERSRPS
jgi:hypothetical protein